MRQKKIFRVIMDKDMQNIMRDGKNNLQAQRIPSRISKNI